MFSPEGGLVNRVEKAAAVRWSEALPLEVLPQGMVVASATELETVVVFGRALVHAHRYVRAAATVLGFSTPAAGGELPGDLGSMSVNDLTAFVRSASG